MVTIDADGTPHAATEFVPTEQQPRGFAVSPDGRFLLCTGEMSSEISLFATEPEGGLTLMGRAGTGNGSELGPVHGIAPKRPGCRISDIDRIEDLIVKFMMFVATDRRPDPSAEAPGEMQAWFDDVNARGKWVTGDRLRPPGDATTVRVRAGELQISNGPYTESEDGIVGFDILDCIDLEDAIEVASKHPMARAGRIELRPFWPFDS